MVNSDGLVQNYTIGMCSPVYYRGSNSVTTLFCSLYIYREQNSVTQQGTQQGTQPIEQQAENRSDNCILGNNYLTHLRD